MTQKVQIIAEAGVNHNGSLDLSYELIDSVSQAGVDYIKFQTFKTELNISKWAEKAPYQIDSRNKSESQFEMVKKLEISYTDFRKIAKVCEKSGVRFCSTGFDNPSIDFLCGLGVDFLKIPSGEITNMPYLRHIASKQFQIIMSTGMATMKEVEKALLILESSGTNRDKVTLLHCNTEYPTPMEDVNLNAMLSLKKEFGLDIGYSDHTLGIEIPIAAVAIGATVIEKHFTLDRTMVGPDHAASLEPDELKEMVNSIRNIEKAMGDGVKKPSKSDKKNIPIARKSIVALRSISKGEILTIENLTVKRPGTGISPMELDNVIGQKAYRDFAPDEQILF